MLFKVLEKHQYNNTIEIELSSTFIIVPFSTYPSLSVNYMILIIPLNLCTDRAHTLYTVS